MCRHWRKISFLRWMLQQVTLPCPVQVSEPERDAAAQLQAQGFQSLSQAMQAATPFAQAVSTLFGPPMSPVEGQQQEGAPDVASQQRLVVQPELEVRSMLSSTGEAAGRASKARSLGGAV